MWAIILKRDLGEETLQASNNNRAEVGCECKPSPDGHPCVLKVGPVVVVERGEGIVGGESVTKCVREVCVQDINRALVIGRHFDVH